MITVRATVAQDGCLSSLAVTGHASLGAGPAGDNVICAAVTAIVRACADAVTNRESIRVSGRAASPGELHMVVEAEEAEREWLRGVTDVLLTGIGRIAQESADDAVLIVNNQGEDHGT